MSVRRLAEARVQPEHFAFAGDNVGWAAETIRKYPDGRQQSAVIPLLMRAQEQDGWVTKAAIEHVADMLKMPLIRVLEVATFYTQFLLKPVGTKAHIQVCGTTPCMLRGSDDLKRVCQARIHEEQFHLNESGTLSWEEVECLGACVNAPMVMIAKDTYEDLTPERLDEIISRFDAGEGKGVKVGPQIDRHLSAPIGGLTSLTSEDGHGGAQGQAGSGPAASGAPAQGEGAGGAASTPPSNAGKPRSATPETDPTIVAKGKATNGNVDQAVEAAAGTDPSEGASEPGAGRTGGSFQGPTGAGGKEIGAENRTSVSADADEVRRDGPLGVKGDEAESAVVAETQRVDPPEGKGAGTKGAPAADADTGVDNDAPLEGRRVSDDVLPGTLADDHMETNDEKRPAASAGKSPDPAGDQT